MRCAYCDSDNVRPRKTKRQTPQYHCRDCAKDFTVKTGTVMQDSKLPLSKWPIAFYLYNTNLKGVSSMKLHRDLGITQKTAWYLAHRIRETWNDETEQVAERFEGPVEADETYVGGKTPVAGIKDRETNQVQSKVVAIPDGPTIKGFVMRTPSRPLRSTPTRRESTSGSGGRMRRSGTASGSTCGNRPARTAWRVSGPV